MNLSLDEVEYLIFKMGKYGNNHHLHLLQKLKDEKMILVARENTQGLVRKDLLHDY